MYGTLLQHVHFRRESIHALPPPSPTAGLPRSQLFECKAAPLAVRHHPKHTRHTVSDRKSRDVLGRLGLCRALCSLVFLAHQNRGFCWERWRKLKVLGIISITPLTSQMARVCAVISAAVVAGDASVSGTRLSATAASAMGCKHSTSAADVAPAASGSLPRPIVSEYWCLQRPFA